MDAAQTPAARPGKRAEKRRSMEEAVLEHAADMLRGGPEALTIAGLAQRLGVSVGGLYRYYPSKGAILVGLEKRAVASYASVQETLLATVEPRLRGRPGRVAALARLLTAARAYPEHAVRAPVEHRLMTQLLSVPEQLLADHEALTVEAELRPIIERNVTLFVDAVSAGALSPGDAVVRTFVLWAALQGADQFRKRDRLLPPALHSTALGAHMLDSLLLGWGAEPRELAAAHRACAD